MKKLVLIDGNSLLNRAFYATPIFTTKSGVPTNAVFGFVKLLFKILGDEKPEYLIVAFDLKAPTFRHKLYSAYKATRKGMPDELAVQVEPLKNLLSAMKVAMCSKEGLEADDIIGTLSKKFDVHSYIYTGDRDSFQLVDEKTDVFYTKRGVSDLLKLSCDNFKKETGIEPFQIIDLKSLMGDKSDNIPGVPGIGEKTAYGLLEKYVTLDGIYENLQDINGSVRTKLEDNKDLAYMSYNLAKINRECGLDIDIENCKSPSKYSEEVREIFKDFEFRSLLSLDIFENNGGYETKTCGIVYPEKIAVTSFSEFEKYSVGNLFYAELNDVSAEIYSSGKLLSVKMSQNLIDGGISCEDYIKVLNKVFSHGENKVIAFNCKNLMHSLEKYSIAFNCEFEDVNLIKYLSDNRTAGLNFDGLCEYYCLDKDFAAYNLKILYEKYCEMLKSENMTDLYERIEKPLLKVLYEMESEGVSVSLEILEEFHKKYEKLLNECKSEIYSMCGKEFNLNSPLQLGEILYSEMGITEVKKKKTGKYTTGAEVLEKIKDKYPIVNVILKYRLYQKLYSTYIEGFRLLVTDKNNVIHTTFNQTATITGRLSSTNPNLQNIPIRGEEGRELRKIFVPKSGNVFIDADYSQIELRLLAHFSGCKELVKAYINGDDIHAVTASQVFGVSLNEVTDDMRREAKAVNFGIIYGMSDFGLSKNLNVSVQTAREYIDKYFATYTEIKEYMNRNVEFARKNGYVSTLTGRKRVIEQINSSNYNLRQFGERAAMNMPLQGSSADIIKIAMVNVSDRLKKEGLKTKLILQVHDELVLDSPEEESEKAAKILKYEMENAVSLTVPLTVDVHIGKSLYEAK